MQRKEEEEEEGGEDEEDEGVATVLGKSFVPLFSGTFQTGELEKPLRGEGAERIPRRG